MKKMKFIPILFLLGFQWLNAQINYTAYDTLLNQYVTKSGRVNYTALSKESVLLDSIARMFSNPAPLDSFSRDEQLAFWINAYNFFTLKLIADNYPVSSITKLDGGKPWDVKRITILGKKYSLNQIENDIIRPKYKDARIHFALNCAAVSCPPLLNSVYLPATLDEQLRRQTRSFIRSKNNTLSEASVKISKIFDWYKADFGNTITFLNRYAKVKINPDATIEFTEYDWGLNKQ
jgi:Protein of unknown function, DUF547